MKMESIPPVHAMMIINVLLSPNMFWEDTYGKRLSAIAICLQLCAHKITSASAGTSGLYYAKYQHLLTVAYHLYRVLTETYSSPHSNPKNQHRLANSSSQSHSKPYAARNVSYWDSKRFRTSASHGFRTRHRLLVKLDDFALQRLSIHVNTLNPLSGSSTIYLLY